MPSILFSVLALLSAFLPPDSGERLGFGVTLLLAREFCKALVQQLTPICDEELWIQARTLPAHPPPAPRQTPPSFSAD